MAPPRATHEGACAEDNVLLTEAGRFGDPEACLNGDDQEAAVLPADSPGTRLCTFERSKSEECDGDVRLRAGQGTH